MWMGDEDCAFFEVELNEQDFIVGSDNETALVKGMLNENALLQIIKQA